MCAHHVLKVSSIWNHDRAGPVVSTQEDNARAIVSWSERRFNVLCVSGRPLEEGPSGLLLRNEALTERGAEKGVLARVTYFHTTMVFTCNQHIQSQGFLVSKPVAIPMALNMNRCPLWPSSRTLLGCVLVDCFLTPILSGEFQAERTLHGAHACYLLSPGPLFISHEGLELLPTRVPLTLLTQFLSRMPHGSRFCLSPCSAGCSVVVSCGSTLPLLQNTAPNRPYFSRLWLFSGCGE